MLATISTMRLMLACVSVMINELLAALLAMSALTGTNGCKSFFSFGASRVRPKRNHPGHQFIGRFNQLRVVTDLHRNSPFSRLFHCLNLENAAHLNRRIAIGHELRIQQLDCFLGTDGLHAARSHSPWNKRRGPA